jgi:hypothetical protein
MVFGPLLLAEKARLREELAERERQFEALRQLFEPPEALRQLFEPPAYKLFQKLREEEDAFQELQEIEQLRFQIFLLRFGFFPQATTPPNKERLIHDGAETRPVQEMVPQLPGARKRHGMPLAFSEDEFAAQFPKVYGGQLKPGRLPTIEQVAHNMKPPVCARTLVRYLKRNPELRKRHPFSRDRSTR